MPFRTPTRWRRARSRRLVAAALLASAAGAVAALTASGPASPVRTAAQSCLPVLCTSSSSSSTSSHSSTSSSRSSSSSSSSSHTTTTTHSSRSSTSYFSAQGTPLPTLPPPSPGSPPQPPSLEVQAIQLALASSAPPQPGGTVEVQATLEAQRGSDTYSVPHATVTFSVTSAPGSGAAVDPQQADAGDTGVVVVTLRTGDQPGDTVLHAMSGSAATDITVHTAPASTPAVTKNPRRTAAVAPGTGPSPARRWLVAGLAALIAATVAGYGMALFLGRLPNPFRRRSVWGRRTR